MEGRGNGRDTDMREGGKERKEAGGREGSMAARDRKFDKRVT